jgi:hypothetical protein
MTPDERDAVNAAVTADVRRTIEVVAPERAAEIADIWDRYTPEVRVLDEVSGFALEGGPYQKIYVSPKDGRLLWLAAFVSWRAVEGFAGYVFEQLATKGNLDLSSPDLRSNELRAFFEYVTLLAKITSLVDAASLADIDWPSEVPEPREGLTGDSLPASERACFELAHFSSAFAFLHELRHVMYAVDGDGPVSTHQEELACDAFAIELILGKIPAAGNEAGDSTEAIRRKRAMALALGISLPILIAPSKHWGQSHTHPSVGERFEQLVSMVDLPPSDMFWVFGSALVLSRLQAEGRFSGIVKAGSAQALLRSLLAQL